MRSKEERAARRAAKRSVIPGKGLTMGVTVTMLSLLILIPLASILTYSFQLTWAEFVELICSVAVSRAFATSIGCALVAALINCVFGLILAWVLVRYEFPGKRLVDAMIELPFALPTAVAGITLSKMYSSEGVFGSLLGNLGIEVSYTRLGIIVALVFIGIPFVVRELQPVIEKLPASFEEASTMLGASRPYTFFHVILPELMPALLTGFGLALARGIGEYGSVIYISGNSMKNGTQVVSYVIMQKLNAGGADYAEAAAIALVLLIVSFVLLLAINLLQLAAGRSTKDQGSYDQARPQAQAAGAQTGGHKAGRRALIATALAFFAVMLVAPLCVVIYRSLSSGLGVYVEAITASNTLSAMRVTLIAAVIAVAVSTVFGLCASWLITKFDFRGRQVLASLIDIPFSISPVIAGLAFIMTFGRMGWATPIVDAVNDLLGTDIQLVFSVPGVVLATIFVTLPYVSRELIPVMQQQGTDEEEAAAMMGASGLTIFRRVTFPHIRWSLLYGIILCAARALGEFGAVYAVSKTRGVTFTLPLEVDALYMAGTADSITQAFAVSSLLVIMAVAILIVKQIVEYRGRRAEETH